MPSERRRMLFVGGVPPQITEELLQAHFKKYGRVHKVKIVVDKKTRESKGYAYITVADARVMPSILKATHVILDRKLDVQLATSKGDKKKWQEDARQKRVFVSSLPNWATAKDLETAFAKFGPIHNAYIIYDYQKATYKDYGYVQFESSADAAVAVKSQISVLGKEVTCQPYLNKTQQLEVAQNAKAGQHQAQGCSGEQPKSCSDSEDGSDEEMLPQQSLPPLEIKNEDPRGPQNTTYENSQMWQVPYTPYRETPCVVGQSSHHFDESIEPFEPRSFSNQHCGVDLQGQVATEASLAASPVYQHESSSSIRGSSKQSTFSLFGTQPAAVKRNSLLTRKKTVGSATGSNTNLNCRPTEMNQSEDNYRFNYNPEPVVFKKRAEQPDSSNYALEIYNPYASLTLQAGTPHHPQVFSMAEGQLLTISAAMRRALLSQDTLGCLQLIHQIAFGGTRAEDLLNSSTSNDNSTLGNSSRMFARQASGEKSQQSRHKSGASRDSSSASKDASSCGKRSPLFTELNDPQSV